MIDFQQIGMTLISTGFMFTTLLLWLMWRADKKKMAALFWQAFRRKKQHHIQTDRKAIQTMIKEIDSCSTPDKLMLLKTILGASYRATIEVSGDSIEIIDCGKQPFSPEEREELNEITG